MIFLCPKYRQKTPYSLLLGVDDGADVGEDDISVGGLDKDIVGVDDGICVGNGVRKS